MEYYLAALMSGIAYRTYFPDPGVEKIKISLGISNIKMSDAITALEKLQSEVNPDVGECMAFRGNYNSRFYKTKWDRILAITIRCKMSVSAVYLYSHFTL